MLPDGPAKRRTHPTERGFQCDALCADRIYVAAKGLQGACESVGMQDHWLTLMRQTCSSERLLLGVSGSRRGAIRPQLVGVLTAASGLPPLTCRQTMLEHKLTASQQAECR